MHYFDSSALVKLVLDERETAALQEYEPGITKMVSSEIARTEVVRAVNRVDDSGNRHAIELLRRAVLVPLSTSLLSEAGRLAPASLRSLDAIHLAELAVSVTRAAWRNSPRFRGNRGLAA